MIERIRELKQKGYSSLNATLKALEEARDVGTNKKIVRNKKKAGKNTAPK